MRRAAFPPHRHSLPQIAIDAVLVGAGADGHLVLREIMRNPALGLNPVGFVDDDPLKRRQRVEGVRVLGTTEDWWTTCREPRDSPVAHHGPLPLPPLFWTMLAEVRAPNGEEKDSTDNATT